MLEFLGRSDNQVKVRGFRIELDEVEGALLKHPSISSAAVICKEDSGGSKYLAAYVAATAPVNRAVNPISRADLREFMLTMVPYHAVPDVFVFMNELPLNLNGKIDRNQLRRRDDSHDSSGNGSPSMSPVEASLLAIAADVLKRAALNVDDNFFETGGNSLRVMEFFTRIRSTLDCDVTLLDIYAYPTIRQLSYRLSAAKHKQLWELQFRNTT